MDLEILKKKISTYRGEGGRLRNVPDDLLLEILQGWESWTSSKSSFYAGIGVTHRKMGSLMGKAKKLKREGYMVGSEFKEITADAMGVVTTGAMTCGSGIELSWEQGKVIRFSQVEQLVDFLKKVA